MSLQAEGAVYLARRTASFTAAPARLGSGMPQLLLYAVSRPAEHCAEPLVLTWAGERAAQFWAAHSAQLTPGQPLHVVLDRLRSHAEWIGSRATGHAASAIYARIVDARLLPRAASAAKTQGEK